jgi:hypothetical protein
MKHRFGALPVEHLEQRPLLYGHGTAMPSSRYCQPIESKLRAPHLIGIFVGRA